MSLPNGSNGFYGGIRARDYPLINSCTKYKKASSALQDCRFVCSSLQRDSNRACPACLSFDPSTGSSLFSKQLEKYRVATKRIHSFQTQLLHTSIIQDESDEPDLRWDSAVIFQSHFVEVSQELLRTFLVMFGVIYALHLLQQSSQRTLNNTVFIQRRLVWKLVDCSQLRECYWWRPILFF